MENDQADGEAVDEARERFKTAVSGAQARRRELELDLLETLFMQYLAFIGRPRCLFLQLEISREGCGT